MAAAKPKSRAKGAPRRAEGRDEFRARIVEAALDIAEDWGWYDIRLHHVAERLGVPLAEVRAEFRDGDAIADAWIARADQAMLAKPGRGFAALPAKERLQRSLEAWLDALAPRREVTAEMFRAKLWPVHVHHNLALVTWTSRTVQWWREAALLDGKGQRRSVEEIGMTLIFLSTLACWCRDRSEDQARSKAYLKRRLDRADRLMAGACALRRRRAATA
ncbi:MAG: TetR/AcrR family transcriptional regulator [Kiloniellaceae bacterium]